MLALAIMTWNHDLIFQPVGSLEEVKELKRRIGSEDRDFVIYEGHMLCPIKLDQATRTLSEEERTEWYYGVVLPALHEEGRVDKKNGRYYSKKENKIIKK
jgi:hypothetical protein